MKKFCLIIMIMSTLMIGFSGKVKGQTPVTDAGANAQLAALQYQMANQTALLTALETKLVKMEFEKAAKTVKQAKEIIDIVKSVRNIARLGEAIYCNMGELNLLLSLVNLEYCGHKMNLAKFNQSWQGADMLIEGIVATGFIVVEFITIDYEEQSLKAIDYLKRTEDAFRRAYLDMVILKRGIKFDVNNYLLKRYIETEGAIRIASGNLNHRGYLEMRAGQDYKMEKMEKRTYSLDQDVMHFSKSESFVYGGWGQANLNNNQKNKDVMTASMFTPMIFFIFLAVIGIVAFKGAIKEFKTKIIEKI